MNNYKVIVHYMEKTLKITMKNLQRYTVLQQLVEGKINATVAVEKKILHCFLLDSDISGTPPQSPAFNPLKLE